MYIQVEVPDALFLAGHLQEPVWEFDEPPSPLNARASLLPPQSSPSPLALTVADESFGGVSAGETVLAQGPSVAGAQARTPQAAP